MPGILLNFNSRFKHILWMVILDINYLVEQKETCKWTNFIYNQSHTSFLHFQKYIK